MATSALSRALRRSSAISSSRYAASLGRSTIEDRRPGLRQLCVFKDLSEKLNSNPEIQKSLEELNKKLGVAKEDLKDRTKKTTEKLQTSVDGAWAEAEATSKEEAAILGRSTFEDKSSEKSDSITGLDIKEVIKRLKKLHAEELRVRTKKMTEKLQKSVDGGWAEAEATSKKEVGLTSVDGAWAEADATSKEEAAILGRSTFEDKSLEKSNCNTEFLSPVEYLRQHRLKFRTKKTIEKLQTSVDGGWAEAEATSTKEAAILGRSTFEDKSSEKSNSYTGFDFKEIKKRLKELHAEELRVRTKKMTEKLQKSVDGGWAEAETTSKKEVGLTSVDGGRAEAEATSKEEAASLGRSTFEDRRPGLRQLCVFKDLSEKLNSNPEIQKSLEELNEKLGVAKEDLKDRTKKKTEKLQTSVDGAWAEAEATSKEEAVILGRTTFEDKSSEKSDSFTGLDIKEIIKRLKELHAEELRVRTKKMTEKLQKSVDGGWAEAEATSKKEVGLTSVDGAWAEADATSKEEVGLSSCV